MHEMEDFSSAFDFDEGEDWTKSFEPDYLEKRGLLSKNDVKSSSSSHNSSKDGKVLGHDRTIIHFDVDCFYAQVEMLKNPELRSKPLGIQQKNIVVTCNYVAREYGVTKLMFITDAKKKCPQLVLVSGEDLTEYRHMSYQITEFIKKYTPCVERLGFDENFVDVSELVGWRQMDHNFESEFYGHEYQSHTGEAPSKCTCGCEERIQIGSQVAADIREALQKELGITSCAGVAHNKVLAKLVAATHKPNQQTSILPHLAKDLVLSLPSPRGIPGIGSKMFKSLQAMGILSVRDLHATSIPELAKELGSPTANLVSQLSFGVDPSPVIPYTHAQTLSDEDSFKCCNNYQDAEERIKGLLNSLMKRVIEEGRAPQTVRLSIRRVGKHSNSRESRQTAVPCNAFTQFHATGSTETAEKRMLPVVIGLFKKMVEPTRAFHLTLINICFAKLVEKGSNSGLLSQLFSKQSTVHKTCDQEVIDDMVDADDQESNSFCSDESLDHDVPGQDEKRFSVVEDIDDHHVHNNVIPRRSDSETLTSFFGKKMFEMKTSSTFTPTKKNKLTGVKDDAPTAATSSVIRQFFIPQNNGDKLNVPENDQVNSQACGNHSAVSAEKLTEQRTQSQIPVLESDVISDEEDTAGTQDERFKDMIGKKYITQECLKDFLPQHIDAQVLLALPFSLQREILRENGISIEETSQGRHFSLISNRVVTRSQGQKSLPTQSRKRPLFSPKKSSPKFSFSDVKRNKNLEEDTSQKSSHKDSCEVKIHDTTANTSMAVTPDVNTEIQIEPTASNLTLSPLESVTLNNSPVQIIEVQSKSGNLSMDKAEEPKFEETFPPTDIPPEKCDIEQELGPNIPSLETSRKNAQNKNMSDDLNCKQLCQTSSQMSSCDLNQCPTTAAEDLGPKRTLLSQSTLKKLPKDINPEVFAELPSDIRGEIMAHVLMGTPVTLASGPSSSGTVTSKKPTLCKLSNSKRHDSNSKVSKQKSLLSYFSKMDK